MRWIIFGIFIVGMILNNKSDQTNCSVSCQCAPSHGYGKSLWGVCIWRKFDRFLGPIILQQRDIHSFIRSSRSLFGCTSSHQSINQPYNRYTIIPYHTPFVHIYILFVFGAWLGLIMRSSCHIYMLFIAFIVIHSLMTMKNGKCAIWMHVTTNRFIFSGTSTSSSNAQVRKNRQIIKNLSHIAFNV